MAPPPPPSKCSSVELPCANVMFCAVSLGFAWSWQCDVVHTCRLSHVSMYRIRRMPTQLSVTFPPPSITTLELVLRTSAVARMTMVTGEGPQRKVTTPPLATASRRLCAAKRVATSVYNDSFARACRESPAAECLAAASAAFLLTIDPGTTGSEIVPGGSNATCLAALSTARSDSLYPRTVTQVSAGGLPVRAGKRPWRPLSEPAPAQAGCARIARLSNGSFWGLVPAVSSAGSRMTNVLGARAGNLVGRLIPARRPGSQDGRNACARSFPRRAEAS